MADTIPPSTQLKHRQPKTASEQSNTNSEKTPRKLTDMIKRVSGSQSDAALMAKASNGSEDSEIRDQATGVQSHKRRALPASAATGATKGDKIFYPAMTIATVAKERAKASENPISRLTRHRCS